MVLDWNVEGLTANYLELSFKWPFFVHLWLNNLWLLGKSFGIHKQTPSFLKSKEHHEVASEACNKAFSFWL